MSMRTLKYKNKKITTDDGTFDSKGELKRWERLKKLNDMGIISDLKRQVKFELLPAQDLHEAVVRKGNKRASRIEAPIEYVADFTYILDGELVVEDFKGIYTDEYKMKRKMMLYIHDIQIREVY